MGVDVRRLRELAEKALAINSNTMLLDPQTVSALVEELTVARAVVEVARGVANLYFKVNAVDHGFMDNLDSVVRAYDDRVRGNNA